MKTGMTILIESEFQRYRGQRLALLCNHTSVGPDFRPSWLTLSRLPGFEGLKLFSPEHGLWGVAQDQELVDSDRDELTGRAVISLYGGRLAPTAEDLDSVDRVIFDIQDIGTRYYTFIYTMLLTMKACADRGVAMTICDRPNPLGGLKREGNILAMEYASFVGMYPLPIVHGMTVGELAAFINDRFGFRCDYEVVRCEGWQRRQWFDETGLPWIAPSPNMPALTTATVYPGGCLFEATTISEGRGTTMPFEIVGAPWIDPPRWLAALEVLELPGVAFRPLWFKPLTNKYAGQVCGGLQIHVSDRHRYQSYLTGLCMISTARELFPEFQFREPPYEFETEKMPFDILAGTDRIREVIEGQGTSGLMRMSEEWRLECERFGHDIEEYLLY